MEEQKELNAKEKEQGTAENTQEGSITATTPLLDQSNETVKRMEAAAERMENATARAEAVESAKILGGRADAGVEPTKVEETPTEYAKRIMAGEVART